MLAQLFLGIENSRITSFSLNDLKLNLDEKQYEKIFQLNFTYLLGLAVKAPESELIS